MQGLLCQKTLLKSWPREKLKKSLNAKTNTISSTSAIRDLAVKEQLSLFIPLMKGRFRLKKLGSNKPHVKVKLGMKCAF
jgi:hypothetical protein